MAAKEVSKGIGSKEKLSKDSRPIIRALKRAKVTRNSKRGKK
jgi:hypothetical protein